MQPESDCDQVRGGVLAGCKRWGLRIVAGLLAMTIAIETFPRRYEIADPLKRFIAPVTNGMGLWQGEWPLFAPNPSLNNAWITAELRAPDGSLVMWNSPYWATRSGWEKFRHFRMLNYTNRIANRDVRAQRELADYILRQEFELELQPVVDEVADESVARVTDTSDAEQRWRMDLFRSQMNMSMPADGTLPSRDDTTWISTSRNFLTREYTP